MSKNKTEVNIEIINGNMLVKAFCGKTHELFLTVLFTISEIAKGNNMSEKDVLKMVEEAYEENIAGYKMSKVDRGLN